MADSDNFTEDDVDSVEKSIILFENGQLNDVATLRQGFNLHRMPQNYLTNRSLIEKVIYHATMSDALKSPFSGFTIANRFLKELDIINVISGIRSLKSLAKLLFNDSQRTSIMVHKIGGTLILDEFNIDYFLLSAEHFHEWAWLRKFLKQKNFHLCESEFSRDTLKVRDLYIKFLYHTVFNLPDLGLQTVKHPSSASDQKCLPAPLESSDLCSNDQTSLRTVTESSVLSNESKTSDNVSESNADPVSKSNLFANDQYLHVAKWKVEDLSFLVGSDLAIFGTPMHPCISLKLSPIHESINVLTGVDIWLENILNEVPEVAMCYHNEGIVMQEYEIYKTCALPTLSGFEAKHVYGVVRNLVMFLKRNATQEGHTYWLVKEPNLGVVKLYDLTAMCASDVAASHSEGEKFTDKISGANPFVIPVATLCYRLAEHRWSQYAARVKQAIASVDERERAPDETKSLLDALRLIKNCLNLITLTELAVEQPKVECNASLPHGLDDLKKRAVVLMCQFYLASPFQSIVKCVDLLLSPNERSFELTTLNLDELSKETTGVQSNNPKSPNASGDTAVEVPNRNNRVLDKLNSDLLGNRLLDVLKTSKTDLLSAIAVSVIQSCSPVIITEPSKTPPPDWILSTSDLNKLSICQYGINETLRTLLPSTMIKTFLNKAEKLYLHCVEQSEVNSEKFVRVSLFFVRNVFRIAFMMILILEHYFPDRYTVLFDQPTVADASPACPYCGSKDRDGTSLFLTVDQDWLEEKYMVASCLTAMSLLCYFDEMNTMGVESAAMQMNQTAYDHSELLMMQVLCEPARKSIVQWNTGFAHGHLDALINDGSTGITRRKDWLEVLNVGARCLYRVCSNLGPDATPGKSRTPKKSHAKCAPQQPSPSTTTSCDARRILVDRLKVNVNSMASKLRLEKFMWMTYVCDYFSTLRSCVQHDATSTDAIVCLRRYLSIVHNSPVLLKELSNRSQTVAFVNLFQAYNVAAQVARTSPDNVHQWAGDFWSTIPLELSPPVLPTKTLLWKEETARSNLKVTFPFSEICAARSVEALIKLFSSQKPKPGDNYPFLSFYFSAISACLDYATSCMKFYDELKITDADYLKTILTVVKLLMKNLPGDFIGDTNRQLVNMSLSRDNVHKLLQLRARTAYITLRWARISPELEGGGASFIETLTSVITRYRNTINWHVKHLDIPKNNGPIDANAAADMVTFIHFVNCSIRLQLYNANVMSVAKMSEVLQDFLHYKPIVDLFAVRLHSDPSVESYVKQLKLPIERALILLSYVTHVISQKHSNDKLIRRRRRRDKPSSNAIGSDDASAWIKMITQLSEPNGRPVHVDLDKYDALGPELRDVIDKKEVHRNLRILSNKLKLLSNYFST